MKTYNFSLRKASSTKVAVVLKKITHQMQDIIDTLESEEIVKPENKSFISFLKNKHSFDIETSFVLTPFQNLPQQ